MVADKSTQEMVQEAFMDMLDDKDFSKVIDSKDIYQLISRGYTEVFKLPEKTAEMFADDNPFITFISVKEGWYYMRLTDYKLTDTQVRELEGPFTDQFRGKVKELEKEADITNKDVQEEFVTDYKGKVFATTKPFITKEVLDITDFETAKSNLTEIIKGLRYTEVWKKQLLEKLNKIEDKPALDKFAEYFYAESERAISARRTYRDSDEDYSAAIDGNFYGDQSYIK